jgi:hypothetical protein
MSKCYYTGIPFEEDGPNAQTEDQDGHDVCEWVAQARGQLSDGMFKQLLISLETHRNNRIQWDVSGAGEKHLEKCGSDVHSTVLCELFHEIVKRQWDQPYHIDFKSDICIHTNDGPDLCIKVKDAQIIVGQTYSDHFSRLLAHPKALEDVLQFVDHVLELGVVTLDWIDPPHVDSIEAFKGALLESYGEKPAK